MKTRIKFKDAVPAYFNETQHGWICRLCKSVLKTVTGISVHWRKTHQHELKISLTRK